MVGWAIADETIVQATGTTLVWQASSMQTWMEQRDIACACILRNDVNGRHLALGI